MTDFLSSSKNPQIKRLKGVQEKAKKRKEVQLFCIEGDKEIRHALAGGYTIEMLYPKEGHLDILNDPLFNSLNAITLEKSLFEQLCFRKNTSTVLALAKIKTHTIEELVLSKKQPLLLIAESPEKPGNIGALLRTADAMGVDAVLLANPKTDLYNPNVIRSSVGCLFSVPIAVGTISSVFSFLEQHNITTFSATLTKEAKNYTQIDFSGGVAIAVGTEDVGLSKQWLAQQSQQIYIPMMGKNDSLNVSVAAGILLAEACRQRN